MYLQERTHCSNVLATWRTRCNGYPHTLTLSRGQGTLHAYVDALCCLCLLPLLPQLMCHVPLPLLAAMYLQPARAPVERRWVLETDD
jgi:hypothetical protein